MPEASSRRATAGRWQMRDFRARKERRSANLKTTTPPVAARAAAHRLRPRLRPRLLRAAANNTTALVARINKEVIVVESARVEASPTNLSRNPTPNVDVSSLKKLAQARSVLVSKSNCAKYASRIRAIHAYSRAGTSSTVTSALDASTSVRRVADVFDASNASTTRGCHRLRNTCSVCDSSFLSKAMFQLEGVIACGACAVHVT